MNVVAPQPNPETVEALLDATWRLAAAEAARTDAVDRKASSLATFASLVAALTATLGIQFVKELDAVWALALFLAGLGSLVMSVGLAALVLRPREYVSLGIEYLKRFATWREILKPPEQARGEMMATLVEAIARERDVNVGKIVLVKRSLAFLIAGLLFIAIEAATLASEEVLG